MQQIPAMFGGGLVVTPDIVSKVITRFDDLVTFTPGSSCNWNRRQAVLEQYGFKKCQSR
jgi:uncharacterized cupin superfamily protein